MAVSKLYDVLIVGGGPAGLSAATSLSRQLHTAVVFDSGAYRNALVKHMHAVPTWDHANPTDFRAKAREDLLKRYKTVEFQTAGITSAKRNDDGFFELKDDAGTIWHGKKLVIATGMKDVFDGEVNGFAECWTKGIYHCLYCDGYEDRGQKSVGVLVNDFMASLPHPMGPAAIIQHIARGAARLADKVMIYSDGREELGQKIRASLKSSRMAVDDRKITQLSLVDGGPNIELDFADGSSTTEGFVVARPAAVQRAAALIDQLGLEMTPAGDIRTTPPFWETSVKGVFAAGDAAASMAPAVTAAVYSGGLAGVGGVSQLQAELEAKDEL